MGIKGLFKEIGAGKRISLCKLAIEHLEETGQPLRVAIDFAIWSFQIQASRGGSNPAIRTLFYRLVRLLSLSIVPIFVFDGPNKPLFKRNKRSRGVGDCVSVAMAKHMFKLFGFHIHDAPGEAEAECALLQKQGIVDAVLSEDVDTIMFGCTRTLRNWSPEGKTGNVPTHVSLYDVAELEQGGTGLGREGMILVALMSGGDYIPEGVPGCGIKLACEAAKAGFGRRLCRIKRADPEAISEWREDLKRELQTNESKFFRRKRPSLVIPDEFPNMDVLRYYTHPIVSDVTTIEMLRREFPSPKQIDLVGLRAFTAETFDWTCKVGAIKFIRVLAPGMLNQTMLKMSRRVIGSDDPGVREAIEGGLIKGIKSRRTHFSTDGEPELRMSYIPANVVRIDLDAEEDEVVASYGRSGLALNSDDEDAGIQNEDGEGSAPKKVYDPFQPDHLWVAETIAKLGVPLTVEDWEMARRSKQLAKEKKASAPRKRSSRKEVSDMPTGAIDKWVTTIKPVSSAPLRDIDTPNAPLSSRLMSPVLSSPKRYQSHCSTAATLGIPSHANESSRERRSKSWRTNSRREKSPTTRPSLDINPWSIANSQATPRAPRTNNSSNLAGTQPQDAILILSSPECSQSMAYAKSAIACTSSHRPNADLRGSSLTLRVPGVQNPFDDDRSLEPASNSPPCHALSQKNSNWTTPPKATAKPKAKQPRNSNATSTATASQSARSTQSRNAKTAAQQQPSIKSFGKNDETTAKRRATESGDKPGFDVGSEDEDEDEAFEAVREFDAKRSKQPPRDNEPAPVTLFPDNNGTEGMETHPLTPIKSNKKSDGRKGLSIDFDSPFTSPVSVASSGKSRTTHLYCCAPTTAEGLGFFEEVQVTWAEADRKMLQHQKELENIHGAKRLGQRRMWRQSEVTFLDLTGED